MRKNRKGQPQPKFKKRGVKPRALRRKRRAIGPRNIIGPKNMRMSERLQREILGTDGGLGMKMSSDGINRQVGIVNNSSIEEKFQVRFEKVSDVFGSTSGFALATSQASGAGQNIQYYLNPGNTLLFPIFSKIAVTYEQFRVNRLRFHWVSEAYTSVGTTISAGRVIMATNFDPDAGTFTTKNQMENYEKAAAFAPYAPHVVHDVMEARGARMKDVAVNNFYVSGSANQSTPVTGQAKFYDLGNFQMATSNIMSATAEMGELWVEYSFTMIRPLQESPLGDAILAAHYTTVPVTAASRYLTGVQQAGSNLSVGLAANTITLPFAGNFLVLHKFTAATSYTDANAITAGTGGTLLTLWCSLGVVDSASAYTAGTGGTQLDYGFVVSCTVPGVVLTYAGTPTIVGTTAADLWVLAVPADLITLFGGKKKETDRLDQLEHMMQKLLRDDWRDSKLDLDYCNSRVPAIPLRSQDEDSKSVSSLRSQGLFRK